MDMTVAVEESEGWAVARVAGDLDVATAPRLRERLVGVIASGSAQVVLDLDGVEFLDSTGLGVIVSALKRTRTHGGDLRIVCNQPTVRKLFELTGLDLAMPLSASIAEAIGAPGHTGG